MNLLIDGFSGSVLKHISKEYLKNLEIPIPKSEDKIKYWVDKISGPYDKKNNKELELKELELEIQNKIKDIIENEEVELGSICDINNKKIKRFDTSYNNKNGKYKFHTGASNGNYYCDNYNIDKYTIILNKTNGSGKCNIFLDKNICCAKQTYICQSKYNENETCYIYYYLLDKISELEKGYIGACHKNLSYDYLIKFKIKIPKNKDLINNLEPLFNKIEKLQTEIKENEILYNQYIQELSNDIK